MTESIAYFPVHYASKRVLVLELAGPIVPRESRGGRSGYRRWRSGALAQLTRQWADHPPVGKPAEIYIKLSGRHLRGGCDGGGIARACLTVMVQAGVLTSDNLIQVPRLSVELSFNPKKEPMATIEITEIAPYS